MASLKCHSITTEWSLHNAFRFFFVNLVVVAGDKLFKKRSTVDHKYAASLHRKWEILIFLFLQKKNPCLCLKMKLIVALSWLRLCDGLVVLMGSLKTPCPLWCPELLTCLDVRAIRALTGRVLKWILNPDCTERARERER